MLIFLWNAFDDRAVARTEASVAAACPGSRIVRLTSAPTKAMNRELQACCDPFFLVLEAGDTPEPEWFANIPLWISSLDDREAGAIFVPEAQTGKIGKPAIRPPLAPQLWRTAAVRSGAAPGFAERELGPFDAYGLLEKKRQLDDQWSWRTVPVASYHFAPKRYPRWQRKELEWEFIWPLLAAKPSEPTSEPKPLFTVVICAYNDAGHLPWAVRSVAVQSIPDWELIIIDDGSSDDTEDMLRSLPQLRDPRIHLLRNDVNVGKAVCLNRALSVSAGLWLLELDADDWLSPDCLETMAAVACEAGDDTGALYADHVEWLERADGRLVPGDRRYAEVFDADRLLDDPIALAPRAYCVSLLRRMEGWRTSDPYGGRLYEDLQMLIRIGQISQLRRIPATLYHRRVRRGSITQRNKALYPAWRAWMASQLSDRVQAASTRTNDTLAMGMLTGPDDEV